MIDEITGDRSGGRSEPPRKQQQPPWRSIAATELFVDVLESRRRQFGYDLMPDHVHDRAIGDSSARRRPACPNRAIQLQGEKRPEGIGDIAGPPEQEPGQDPEKQKIDGGHLNSGQKRVGSQRNRTGKAFSAGQARINVEAERTLEKVIQQGLQASPFLVILRRIPHARRLLPERGPGQEGAGGPALIARYLHIMSLLIISVPPWTISRSRSPRRRV